MKISSVAYRCRERHRLSARASRIPHVQSLTHDDFDSYAAVLRSTKNRLGGSPAIANSPIHHQSSTDYLGDFL